MADLKKMTKMAYSHRRVNRIKCMETTMLVLSPTLRNHFVLACEKECDPSLLEGEKEWLCSVSWARN